MGSKGVVQSSLRSVAETARGESGYCRRRRQLMHAALVGDKLLTLGPQSEAAADAGVIRTDRVPRHGGDHGGVAWRPARRVHGRTKESHDRPHRHVAAKQTTLCLGHKQGNRRSRL